MIAVDLLGVDAAILFADILLLLEPLERGLEFTKENGPRLRHPVRAPDDVGRLRHYDVDERLSFVYETVRIARRELAGRVPLIGFSGAPFTLASYLIEGGGSRDYLHTKSFMYRHPDSWAALMSLLARLVGDYLRAQVAAGADAVQVFDSWVGCLAPADYRRFVLPYTRAAIGGLSSSVPVIHFGTGTAGLLESVRETGASVIGLDWRVDLDAAWRLVGTERAIQGNLDPAALLAPPAEIRRLSKEILDRAGAIPGHIFNLGHGVLPATPVDHVRILVDAVHEMSAR